MARRKKKESYTLNKTDQLSLFLIRMSELLARRYYKQAECRMDGTTLVVSKVDEDVFAAFLLTFRHFWATSEPTNIDSVKNTIKAVFNKVNDVDALTRLEEIEHSFKNGPIIRIGIHDDDGYVFKYFDQNETFRLFVNTKYFHNDVAGMQLFYQLPSKDQDAALKCFRFALYQQVKRLVAYIPLVLRALGCGVLPRGAFRLGDPDLKLEDAPFKILLPVNLCNFQAAMLNHEPKVDRHDANATVEVTETANRPDDV